MFNAGSNLRGKSVEEICFQDFKVFNVKDIMFGVGQITSMNQDELDEVKGRLIPYLEEARKTQGLHMLYLMMTNILEESTELLCCGENAKEQVLEAFELPGDTEKSPERCSIKKETDDPCSGNLPAAKIKTDNFIGEMAYGKTDLEAGKYAVSTACSYGQCGR